MLKKKLKDGWWNYRFIARPNYFDDKVIGNYYEMIEVYYNKGEIIAWSDDIDGLVVESYKELKKYLKMIKHASKRSILALKNGELTDTGLYMNVTETNYVRSKWKKMK